MSKQISFALSITLILLFACCQANCATAPAGFHYPLGGATPKILKPFGATAGDNGSEDRWLSGARLRAAGGDAVYAVADGEVTKVSPSGWGRGNSALIVRHTLADGRKFIAVYGCVRKYLTGRVLAGQRIAVVGPGGYLHFGVFESLDGLGGMPYVRAQYDYAMPFFPRPTVEVISGISSFGRWFDPIEYLRRRWPQPFFVGQQVIVTGAPGAPILIEPIDGSFWNWAQQGRILQLRVSNGLGAIPTAYRFRVRRAGGTYWITTWNDWTSGWIAGGNSCYVNVPVLIPGDYWWEAQARNSLGEGIWRPTRRHFHVNYPPRAPSVNSPAEGQAVASRQVTISWNDPGDPDNYEHHRLTYRVLIGGDWTYDSGWDVNSTSLDVTVPRDGRFTCRVAASDGWDHSGFGPARAFMVDTEAPAITITGPSVDGWTNRNTVSWTITDSMSGIDGAGLRFDSGAESSARYVDSAAVPEGRHSIVIRARDKAGNTAIAGGGEYWIDTVRPTVAMSLNPPFPDGREGYTTSCTLSASAEDPGGSGVDALYCGLGAPYGDRYTGPVTVSHVGSYNYSVRAIDRAGNQSRAIQGRILIEKPQNVTPPPRPEPQPVPQPTPQPVPQPIYEPPAKPSGAYPPPPAPVPPPPVKQNPPPPAPAPVPTNPPPAPPPPAPAPAPPPAPTPTPAPVPDKSPPSAPNPGDQPPPPKEPPKGGIF